MLKDECGRMKDEWKAASLSFRIPHSYFCIFLSCPSCLNSALGQTGYSVFVERLNIQIVKLWRRRNSLYAGAARRLSYFGSALSQ
jgi:hypothetical protein